MAKCKGSWKKSEFHLDTTKPRPKQDGVLVEYWSAFAWLRARKPLPLGFGDLAALDAACADANALRGTVDEGFDGLKIHIPAAPRDVVRVRDVVAKLRTFTANITYLCHYIAPNLSGFVLPEPLLSDFRPLLGLLAPVRPLGAQKDTQPLGLPNLKYTRNSPSGQGVPSRA
jgi:hypothetical protein